MPRPIAPKPKPPHKTRTADLIAASDRLADAAQKLTHWSNAVAARIQDQQRQPASYEGCVIAIMQVANDIEDALADLTFTLTGKARNSQTEPPPATTDPPPVERPKSLDDKSEKFLSLRYGPPNSPSKYPAEVERPHTSATALPPQ
jgi:hypothetical protein